ncbi:MAG TPA: hypothetical protein VMH81_22565 [Bryobacteraceae bacterium]|nr:hypothetical protein [Bryobacteraceae bacterium]
MWPAFTVIGYFALALLLPIGWGLGRTWRRARIARHVTCPDSGIPALVRLDAPFAVRMHARGDREPLARDCTRWAENRKCDQGCLTQIGTMV